MKTKTLLSLSPFIIIGLVLILLTIIDSSSGQQSASKKSGALTMVPTEQTLYTPGGDTLEFRIQDGYFLVKDNGQYKKLVAWINLSDSPKPLAVANPYVGYGESSWEYVILVYCYPDGTIKEAFMDIASREVQSVQTP